MTNKLTYFWIILVIIAIVGAIGAFWYLGSVNPLGNRQSGDTSFSVTDIHSLYPGTYFVSDIMIGTPLQEVPDKLMVYSKQQMSEDEIFRIASDLGITGEPTKETGWIFIRDDPCIFSAQPGGRVITYDDETPIPGISPEYIDSHLPSDEDAKKIADEFLKTHNIHPGGLKFAGTDHNVGYYTYNDEWIKNDEKISVKYRHFINDYEIFNEKLGLEVTINRSISSMFWKWTRYQPYREYQIVSPEKAVAALQKTGIVVIEGMQSPERAMVRNITLGYLGETHSKDLD